jgi:hypothetical protein
MAALPLTRREVLSGPRLNIRLFGMTGRLAALAALARARFSGA